MFNKNPRRNFRQRKQSSSDEEEEQRETGGDGADAERPQAAVKQQVKAAPGRGISCSSKQELTPPRRSSPPDSSDGEEALEETEGKQERNKDKQTSNTVLSFSEDKEAEEPTFKVKKSCDKAVVFRARKKEPSSAKTSHSTASARVRLPPPASPTPDSDSQSSPQSLHHSDGSDDDDDDDDEDNSDDNKRDYVDSDEDSSMCSSLSPASSHSSVQPVRIPDAKTIQAAKRQREAIRSQKEFISLGRDGHSSAGSTPSHYSRDEDEEDRLEGDEDEPDNHQRRIEFAPRQRSIRERIAEKLGESDDSLSGTDKEEQELWETTQIGKGVKRQPGQRTPSGSDSSGSRQDGVRQKKRAARAKVPKTNPPVTVAMMKKRMNAKLDSLKEVSRVQQVELRRMEGDIENGRMSAELLDESSSAQQLKFYRRIKVYIHNLVECLQEKIVEINMLELELHTLLADQMEALLAERRQKVKEQAELLQRLSYSAEEQTGSSGGGSDSQGFGNTEGVRDVPEDSRASAEEEEQLERKMAGIISRSQEVFSDVQEDFWDVKKILSGFEEWRECHSDSYHTAYISLCLPKLLNPIIRHQLLAWNPLKDATGDFENLPWFTAVETFCHGHGHEELDVPDRETLSKVVERTVVPKMTAFVDLVWDPVSRHQSICLSDVCHRLKDDYSIFDGEQSKPVKTFMEAVMNRLRSCVDEDIFIPLYPKKFLDDTSSPQSHFRDQQLWMAIKLLENMGKWDLLLPETLLKELMLDKLLSRYLMIALSTQTLSNTDLICKKIVDSLPLSWFKDMSVCLPQLQNFEKHLVQKVHTLCKQQSPKDPDTRAAVVEILLLLSRIRCNNSIMNITQNYHFEDIIYSHQLLNQDAE